MLASLLIVFREVFEAGLVIGIVLTATQGVARRGGWIACGMIAGIMGAAILAFFAGALSRALSGYGQEVFNAGILLAATLMLIWHSLWMARHGRDVARQMREVGDAVSLNTTSLAALAVVIATAVLREGAEVVLFLYGIATSTQEAPALMLLGGTLGLGLGSIVSWLLYRGLITIHVKRLFTVTNVLIALLAAGMAGQAAAILAGADFIPSWGYQLWDSSRFLSESSWLGRALHALVGYSDRPMGVQLAAYLVVFLGTGLATRFIASHASRPSMPYSRNPLARVS